jgi:hypothetical protein
MQLPDKWKVFDLFQAFRRSTRNSANREDKHECATMDDLDGVGLN